MGVSWGSSNATINLISNQYNATFEWVTAMNYTTDNIVSHDGTLYVAQVNHVSDDFATDLAAGYWKIYDQLPVIIDNYTTGEDITSLRVVVLINGLIYHFDPTNILHYNKVIGVSIETIGTGLPIRIQSKGKLVDASFGLTADKIYQSDVNGILIPTSDPLSDDEIFQKIGISLDSVTLVIDLGIPIAGRNM